jgi:hypothetical protein
VTVGCASGTEKVALPAQLWHDSGHWVYKTDYKNAFNDANLKRTAIINGLLEVDPSAVPAATRRVYTPAKRPAGRPAVPNGVA